MQFGSNAFNERQQDCLYLNGVWNMLILERSDICVHAVEHPGADRGDVASKALDGAPKGDHELRHCAYEHNPGEWIDFGECDSGSFRGNQRYALHPCRRG